MELEKIIKLIDAGYTKAEIEKMLTPAAEETKPDPEPAPEPKPEEKKPESEPVNAQMLKELQDLKKAVYAMNIMNTEQPEQKSIDDILAASLKEG
jgi:hypothetical protein